MLMDNPSDNYVGRAVEAFRNASHRHRDDNSGHAVLFEQSRALQAYDFFAAVSP
jgi:hypothetical protein